MTEMIASVFLIGATMFVTVELINRIVGDE